MKKVSVLLIAFLCAFSLYAENQDKITEIGFTTTSILFIPIYSTTHSNLILKFGNEKLPYRFSSINFENSYGRSNYLDGDEVDTTGYSYDRKSFEFGFAVGREFRKNIDENFQLRFGADITFGYQKSYDDRVDASYSYYLNESYSIYPGITLVLGANYVIKDKFVIGMEINPRFYYRYQVTIRDRDASGDIMYDYSSSNTFYTEFKDVLLFSFSYRF